MNNDFNFPDNKFIDYGIIKHSFKKTKSLIDISKPSENIITINKIDYIFTYLTSNGMNKGGNSIILKLYESQSFDYKNLNYDVPDYILKILKYKKTKFINKSNKRFLKEIDILKKCNEKKCKNVIKLMHNGTCQIVKRGLPKEYDEYLFYTMEYAESDLKSYIENNHNILTLEEKISLCLDLARGIKELYKLKYYHRDIKPDNIFMTGDGWKIGDLGLAAERNKSSEIDKVAEFVGPRGWVSPEAMNKYLCEGKGFKENFSSIIDHQSDIFQLGKVFWYILQHNTPVGSVRQHDFKLKNNKLYPILRRMLNQSKKKRYSHIDEVIDLLVLINKELLIK